MKKFISALAAIVLLTSTVKAQSECLGLFPPSEGTVMVNTNYDANDQVLGTSIYRINKFYNIGDQPNMDMGLTVQDSSGNAVEHADINVYCDSETFRMTIKDHSISPDFARMIAERSDLVSNFLNYPILISENFPDDRFYELEDSEITIVPQSDKNESITVKIRDRKFEDPKSVTTPAGTYNAWKISFDFDVMSEEGSKSYKANEWFAYGIGLIRSETYDSNNNLLNYSVLTTFRDKK